MNLTELLVTSYDSERKIWSGPKRTCVFDVNCSVGQTALFMLRSQPVDAVCQISDTERTTLTFHSASDYAVRIAQHLKRLGITQEDIVGIMAPNTTLLMPLIVGCWLNGTAFHAVNTLHEVSTIRNVLTSTKPKLLVIDGASYAKIREATADMNVKFFTICNDVEGVPRIQDLLEPTVTEYYYQAEFLKHGADQVMAIYCSSGTTGDPKCVSVANAGIFTLLLKPVNGTSTIFSFSTPDWPTGLVAIAHNIFVGGTRIITTRNFSPQYMLEIIAKYKVTFLAAGAVIMTQVSQLPTFDKAAMQSIRVIFMTGDRCSVGTLERIRAQLSGGMLINSYASTETGGIAANLSNYKAHTAGRVLANAELRIIDVPTGAALGHNQVGEICARYSCKWPGYYANAAATAQLLDADGWTRTGDLGCMDDENYLHLIERSKDIMKYEGEHFSPHEIEEIILELPDVVDVCVFGVFDEHHGDLAAAAVVKKHDSTLDAADIVKYVNTQAQVEHKRLHSDVFFVEALARNANGKVLRRKIKEQCLAK